MRSVLLAQILPFARAVPSPSAPVLLCLLICHPPCVLCDLLIPFSGGLPRSLPGSLAEPVAPLPFGLGSGTPPSPMLHPLPELPADSSRIDALSEAAFWRAEMACHRSMVIAGHHGYDLAAKAYLEAVEKLVALLASGQGKEREGK